LPLIDSKKFNLEILRLLPDFRHLSKGFFYEPPTEHVLVGFAWDRPPGMIYLWKYAFPLYDTAGFLHFSYGDRLPKPEDWMPARWENAQEMAEEYVRRIMPYREEIRKLRDLDCFLAYQKGRSLGNPVIRKGFAMTLVMAGQPDQALKQLKLCQPWRERPDFDADVMEWIKAIQDGSALGKLHARERRMREEFGIE